MGNGDELSFVYALLCPPIYLENPTGDSFVFKNKVSDLVTGGATPVM